MSNRYQQDAAAWLRKLADEVGTKRAFDADSIHVNFYKGGSLVEGQGYHKPRTKEHNHG